MRAGSEARAQDGHRVLDLDPVTHTDVPVPGNGQVAGAGIGHRDRYGSAILVDSACRTRVELHARRQDVVGMDLVGRGITGVAEAHRVGQDLARRGVGARVGRVGHALVGGDLRFDHGDGGIGGIVVGQSLARVVRVVKGHGGMVGQGDALVVAGLVEDLDGHLDGEAVVGGIVVSRDLDIAEIKGDVVAVPGRAVHGGAVERTGEGAGLHRVRDIDHAVGQGVGDHQAAGVAFGQGEPDVVGDLFADGVGGRRRLQLVNIGNDRDRGRGGCAVVVGRAARVRGVAGPLGGEGVVAGLGRGHVTGQAAPVDVRGVGQVLAGLGRVQVGLEGDGRALALGKGAPGCGDDITVDGKRVRRQAAGVGQGTGNIGQTGRDGVAEVRIEGVGVAGPVMLDDHGKGDGVVLVRVRGVHGLAHLQGRLDHGEVRTGIDLGMGDTVPVHPDQPGLVVDGLAPVQVRVVEDHAGEVDRDGLGHRVVGIAVDQVAEVQGKATAVGVDGRVVEDIVEAAVCCREAGRGGDGIQADNGHLDAGAVIGHGIGQPGAVEGPLGNGEGDGVLCLLADGHVVTAGMGLVGGDKNLVRPGACRGDPGTVRGVGDRVVRAALGAGIVGQGGRVVQVLERRDIGGGHQVIGDDQDVGARGRVSGGQGAVGVVGQLQACEQVAAVGQGIAGAVGHRQVEAGRRRGKAGGHVVGEADVKGAGVAAVLYHDGKGDQVAGIDASQVGVDVVSCQPVRGDHRARLGPEAAAARLGEVAVHKGVAGKDGGIVVRLHHALGNGQLGLVKDHLADGVRGVVGKRGPLFRGPDLVGQVHAVGKGLA